MTVENFLAYVDAGFFDKSIFHRVIPGFVLQGGGFTEKMEQKKTRSPIKNEAENGLKNNRSTLSMARTSDINSATSQFFINLKDNSSLDHGTRDFGYAVFAIERVPRLFLRPFFDKSIFHRVIPGFVLQGGGFTEKMEQKKTRSPIKNEAENGLKNNRSTLSMARTSDINSATSQFFINLKDNSSLDHGTRDFGYAVFAKVTAGMDVVDKIAAVPTGNRGMFQDVPVKAVIIQSARRK